MGENVLFYLTEHYIDISMLIRQKYSDYYSNRAVRFFCNKLMALFAVAMFTAVDPPVITAHPMNQLDVPLGSEAVFTVSATGPSLTYQWQGNEVDILNSDGKYTGTNTSELRVLNVSLQENGAMFRCIVTNPVVKQISGNATLTVCKSSHLLCHTYVLLICTKSNVFVNCTALFFL